jgi:hypothetical protein
MIMKETGAAGDTADWFTYHSSNTSAPETDFLRFNTNAATADSDEMWNDTAPTSSVFTVGVEIGINGNTNTYVAYLFREIEGFSKFGVFTGNGNVDGPFIYTGFKPALFISKSTSTTYDWTMWNNKANTYNPCTKRTMSNSTSAEIESSAEVDFLADGVKIRNSSVARNASGVSFIVMAFAENPFGGDGVAPATAR